MCMKLFVSFPCYLFWCLQDLYWYPISLLISTVCVFSLFFVSLAKSLSILMNFSKKQVLVSFSLFFLFSISLISVLFSFFPYSCFGFILLYFSRFLRCELRLLIWSETHLDFFFFLMYAFSAINALLRWAPQMLIYFHIHSVPCIFFYFLWGFHFDARIT